MGVQLARTHLEWWDLARSSLWEWNKAQDIFGVRNDEYYQKKPYVDSYVILTGH